MNITWWHSFSARTTPAVTAASGSYPLTLTAANAVGSSTQSFTLTLN
jgi:hypothetical protein